MRPTLPAAVLLVLALAACAPGPVTTPGFPTGTAGSPSGPDAPTSGAPSPRASASPTAAPAPTKASPLPANTRVVVNRSGGFAGRSVTLTVEPDGRWTRDGAGGRSTGRLTDDRRTRLRALVTDPRLVGESGMYLTQGCADSYLWQVTAGPVRVTYMECLARAKQPPVSSSIVELIGPTD